MHEHPTVEQLLQENQSLRDQLARRAWADRLIHNGLSGTARLAGLVIAGPSLVNALRRWMTVHKADPLRVHVDEWAELIAALTRRLLGIGIFALLAALLSTALHVHQNLLLIQQNRKLDTQNHLVEAQRRAGLMFELTSILEEVEQVRKQWVAPAETHLAGLRKQVAEEGQRQPSQAEAAVLLTAHIAQLDGVMAAVARQKREQHPAELFDEVLKKRRLLLEELAAGELEKAYAQMLRRGLRPALASTGSLVNEPLPLSEGMVGRIVALSTSLRPYRYLAVSGDRQPDTDRITERLAEEPPELGAEALSPERGQLLQTLIRSGVDMAPIAREGAEFTFADLRQAKLDRRHLQQLQLTGADLSNAALASARAHAVTLRQARLNSMQAPFADFSHANLSGSTLDRAVLTGAFMQEARLVSASLRGANLDKADLTNTNLAGADLTDAYLTLKLAGADLEGARLDGAVVPDEHWLDHIAKLQPAVRNFDPTRWRIQQETARTQFYVRSGSAIFVLRRK